MGNICSSSGQCFLLPDVCGSYFNLTIQAVIDSGTKQNLISQKLVDQLQIRNVPLQHPLSVTSLTGQTIPTITHKMETIHVVISGNHHEQDEFFFCFPSAPTSHVLGFPWLQRQNPVIYWTDKRVWKVGVPSV